MSEGNDHDYVVRARQQPDDESDENDDVQSSNSSEAFQPILRRRRRLRLNPTQAVSQVNNSDHDYVEAPPNVSQSQRRSTDALPIEEDDDNDDDDDEDDMLIPPNPEIDILHNRADHDYAGTNSSEEQENDAPGAEIADVEANAESNVETSAPPNVDAIVPIESDEANEAVGVAENGNEVDGNVAPDEATTATAAGDVPANNVEPIVLSDEGGTPSPPKKRKRYSAVGGKSGTPKVGGAGTSNGGDDDEDDGLTCPICLDHWEMSGEHRLVSLRCGHLFGDSCIRRWLNESMRQSAVKVCPQCKSKAANKDIRFLYAKRLRAIDRTEEHRLRKELDDEKSSARNLHTELSTVKMQYQIAASKVRTLEADNDRLRLMVRNGGTSGAFTDGPYAIDDPKCLKNLTHYRLYMEKNFEITGEPGCRVMTYSSQHSALIASQKSTQNLFPGYGVRFIDAMRFRPLNFLHTSAKLVRDICLSADQQQLAVTSLETRCKIFDLRTRQVCGVFIPSDKPVWSCAIDRNEREHFLYLGNQGGSTFVYDMRYPESVVREFQTDGDFSPVIHIAPVPSGMTFPCGGFLVCKLTSLWFFEYTNDGVVPTRLNIDGPFLSLNYDVIQETLLVSARSNQSQPKSRFIFGKLEKIDGTTIFDACVTFYGSKPTPIMTRSAQIQVAANTMVVGYLQDHKQLVMYDVRRGERVQTMPVNETVYDTCSIQIAGNTFLAALTDNRCRIYKVNSMVTAL